MSKRPSAAMIGAFVIGALVLLVVAVVLLGSGRLFRETVPFVLSFTGSVNGLNVGAPVKFKGVEIGSVTDVRLTLGEGTASSVTRIPVLVEIDQEKVESQGAHADLWDPAVVKALIDAGLRGQLNAQSLVTGLLFIELDFHPGTPAEFAVSGGPYQEIPTVPTVLQKAQSALGEIIGDIQAAKLAPFIENATKAVEGINRLVNLPDTERAFASLDETLASMNEAMTALKVASLSLDKRAVEIGASVGQFSSDMRTALTQMRATLKTVDGFVEPSSPLSIRLNATLEEISNAARSVRILADYLERNPAAVVRGRSGGQ
jgi:paraquat-inducible protein B